MSPHSPLVVLAVIAAAAAAGPAASAATKPCPRGTVPSMATGRAPRGMTLARCVPRLRTAPAEPTAAGVAKLVVSRAVLARVPKGAPRPRLAAAQHLEAVARKVRNPFVVGQPPPAGAKPVSARGARARAAAGPTLRMDLGQVRPGIRATGIAKLDGGVVGDATLRLEDAHGNAAEATVGVPTGAGEDTGSCPLPDGRIHRTLPLHLAYAVEASVHGKTTRVEVRATIDVDYRAQVGDNAKLQTFAVSSRSALEIFADEWITATGKIVRHEPTRVYRAAYDFGGPWTGTPPDVEAAVRAARLFAPRVPTFDRATEIHNMGIVLGYAAGLGIGVVSTLDDMQHHWYDDEACLTLSLGGQGPVREGGQVEYSPTLLTLQGERPRAHYDASTGCPGQLDHATADVAGGMDASPPAFTITDAASEWRTVRGPCITVVGLSPAGKKTARVETPVERLPVPVFHLHATIKTVYDCGGESQPVVLDDATLDGDVTARDPEDEHAAVGSGTMSGTATTLLGGCDNADTQTLSGVPVKITAQYAGDGTLSISWVPDQAMLRWAKLGFLHPGSGTKVEESDQPDGNTGSFHTTFTVTVSGLQALTA